MSWEIIALEVSLVKTWYALYYVSVFNVTKHRIKKKFYLPIYSPTYPSVSWKEDQNVHNYV